MFILKVVIDYIFDVNFLLSIFWNKEGGKVIWFMMIDLFLLVMDKLCIIESERFLNLIILMMLMVIFVKIIKLKGVNNKIVKMCFNFFF